MSLLLPTAFAAPPIDYVEGQIIVKGKAGMSDAQLEKILNKSRGRSIAKLQQIDTHIVQVPPQAEDAVIRALSHNPQIDFAEKNPLLEPSAIAPNDPYYTKEWHLAKIQAPGAWDYSAGEGITVAILDAGVETSHPDLVNNLVPGQNVVSNNSDTSPINVHGTAVAGTVAATTNNAMGVSSVAWNASLMPVRITNSSDGWASASDMANGILWAADHGAKVVNISYDIGSGASVIDNAAQYLRNKGGVVVMAAGNNGTDRGYNDNPYIINVSATTSSDALASFSDYGKYIDVSAPGKDIYTTWQNGGYGWGSGTSFASPNAAAIVALIMSANPQLSPDEVESILETSADDLGSNGWDPYFGYGRVNAAAAVQIALGASAPDTQAPDVAISSPAYNSIVSGQVLVTVDALDNVGVTQVTLYANGQSVGSDSTAPYEFSFDSTQVANGNTTFTAYAYDAAGNTGISNGVTVSVENQTTVVDTLPPSVTILSPSANQTTVSGSTTVVVSAVDDTGVTGVTLYVNGRVVGTDQTAPYEFYWDSTKTADGTAVLTAEANDAAGNIGISSDVSVIVNNSPVVADSTPPLVSIINLTDGDTVSGTVGILVNASDDTSVIGLSLFIDGSLECSSVDTSSLSCNWNTRKASDGSHTIKATATDAAGNSSATSISVTLGNSTSSSGNPGKAYGKKK